MGRLNTNTSEKVIGITGGSRGIGAGIVEKCIEKGNRVFFCLRHETPELIEFVEKFPKDQVAYILLDISEEESGRRFIDFGLEQFGQVDVICNNAGISIDDLFVNGDAEQWKKIINVNLLGGIWVAKYAVLHFIKEKIPGSIVHIGSLAEFGAPSNAVYSFTKGGIAGLSKHINRQYGQIGITSNVVTLGLIETPLTENYPEAFQKVLIENALAKRAGSIAEVASLVYHVGVEAPEIYQNQRVHFSGGLIDFPIFVPLQ